MLYSYRELLGQEVHVATITRMEKQMEKQMKHNVGTGFMYALYRLYNIVYVYTYIYIYLCAKVGKLKPFFAPK